MNFHTETDHKSMLCLYSFGTIKYKEYPDYLWFERIDSHQNIANIVSTKCVNDLKCQFNTNNPNRKDLCSAMSSIHLYDEKSDMSIPYVLF